MKYPLIAIPLSALLVLTGCGGSGSSGDDAPTTTPVPPPPPPPAPAAPTVSVVAPASAIVGVPFTLEWSSTNATSCSSTAFTGNATSGTNPRTVMTAGEVTYEVTCAGDGGSATGSAVVLVVPKAIAEGIWQGSSTDNAGTRAVAGVITKEDKYWIIYSEANQPGNVAGFFAGTGASTPNSDGTSGTFPSSDLREFNFGGGTAGAGSLTATAFDKTGADKAAYSFNATTTSTDLTASYTFGGSQAYDIDEVTGPGSALGGTLVQTPTSPTFTDGGSPWTITPNANNLGAAPGVSGSFNFEPYAVNVDLPNLGQVDLTVPARVLTFSGGTVLWTPNNSDPNDPQGGVLEVTDVMFNESSPGQTCSDGGTTFCSAVPGASTPAATHGNLTITIAADMLTYTGVAIAHQNVDMLAQDQTGICYMDGGANPCANNTLTFSGTVPNAASLTQQLATTYNAAYESAPALADLTGSYAGTDGVGAAINSNGALAVDAQGAITATVENGQCAVTGSLVPHTTGGNLYDAQLVFANGSGTCTYAGAFAGVAVYSAELGGITITATNSARDQGFLFVGAKAQ